MNKTQTHWYEPLRQFKDELGIPTVLTILVGAPAAWWDFIFHGKVFGSPEKMDIALAIMVGSVVFFLTYTVKLAYGRMKELRTGATLGEQIVEDFQSLSPLSELIKDSQSDTSHLKPFLSAQFEHIRKKGGGYLLLQVSNGTYLKTLTTALEEAQNSFYAILTDEYFPSWFFRPELNTEGKIVFSSAEKQEYLAVVNKHGRKLRPIRIMIFDDDRLKEDFAKMNPRDIIKFFKLHSGVRLYQIDPAVLQDLPGYPEIGEVIHKDFAMIDDCLILKKSKNKSELSLLISNHNKSYGMIFEKIYFQENRRRFRNLKQIVGMFVKASRLTVKQKAKLYSILVRAPQ